MKSVLGDFLERVQHYRSLAVGGGRAYSRAILAQDIGIPHYTLNQMYWVPSSSTTDKRNLPASAVLAFLEYLPRVGLRRIESKHVKEMRDLPFVRTGELSTEVRELFEGIAAEILKLEQGAE